MTVSFQRQAPAHADPQAKRASVKLSKAQESYSYFSSTASTIARQIAFAGIGVVWVFNLPAPHTAIAIPQPLRVVVLLLVVCLALDLLQYAYGSLVWAVFARILERGHANRSDEDPEMDASPYLNWPSLACFWVKLVVLVIAYICLAAFIASKLHASTPV